MKERKSIMKKTIVAMMIMAMTAASVAGCGSSSNDTAAAESTTDAAADTTADVADTAATDDTAAADDTAAGSMSGAITVLSREDGSGTRGASSSCSVLSRKMQMVIK